jgi:energy-coupling factor transporter ATP-binding protein EcfA2
MERNFRKFLAGIAQEELSENLLANLVVRYYKDIQFEYPKRFFESVFEHYRRHEKEGFPELVLKEEDEITQLTGDFRLKSVRIANVRGIGESIEGIPYGIDLQKKNKIQSAIILGPNGSGKSSLFGAVEFIYANEIGEALLRNEKGRKINFENYLTRYNSLWETAFCQIETMSGTYDLNNRLLTDERAIRITNPHNHFISDYDIYENGKLSFDGNAEDNYTFHTQVAKSLGLEDYLQKANEISDLSDYNRLTEKNALTRLVRDQNLEKLNIGKWEAEIKELETRKKNIKISSKDKNNSIIDSNEIINRLRRTDIPEIPLHNVVITKIKEFRLLYNKYVSFEGLDESKNEVEFLNLSLNLLEHDHIQGNCPLCNDSRLDSDKIKKDVKIRINILKELGELSRTLQLAYQDVISELNYIKSQFDQIVFVLENEISENKGEAIFKPLIDKQEPLLKKLREHRENKAIIDLNDLTNDVLKGSLGYEGLFEYLSNTSNYFQEDLKILIDTLEIYSYTKQDILEKLSRSLVNEPSQISSSNQLKQTEAEIIQKNRVIEEANKKIGEFSIEIDKANKEVKLRDSILKDADEFRVLVVKKIDDLIIQSIEPIKTTIEAILSDYLNEEEDGISILVSTDKKDDSGRKILRAEIIKNDTNEVLSPNKFFNTFRYRLFAMMISCSIAIASRKNTKLNLPLVLDDVFFASDYVSRAGMKKFLVKLIQIFEEQTPDLPLQFILFTHDDSIFSFAQEALKEYDRLSLSVEGELKSEKGMLEANTVVGRLFPYYDLSNELSGENPNQYWSLISTISTNKENDIVNELLSNI